MVQSCFTQCASGHANCKRSFLCDRSPLEAKIKARRCAVVPVETSRECLADVSRVAVGDFNGDRQLDLAVSGDFFERPVILFRTDMGFSPPLSVGMNGISVAAGDFNGDGIDDLAVANSDSVSILLGSSLVGRTFPAGERFSTRNSIAVGDFNGDRRRTC